MFGVWIIVIGILICLVLCILDLGIELEGTGAIIGCIVLILSLIFGAAFIDAEYYPIAAEEAQQYCEAHGYDVYNTFNRKPFGTEAYGIRCNYIQNRKELITDAETVIAVSPI